MAKSITELQVLENSRVALHNVDTMLEVKYALIEYGYNNEKIEEGNSLYRVAKEKFDTNKDETNRERTSYDKFSELYDEVVKKYMAHRKIAKVALIEDKNVWEVLKLSGIFPNGYLPVMEVIRTFYKQAKANISIAEKLNLFKIKIEDIDAQLVLLDKVESLKAEYEKSKGRSQDATQQKNKALSELNQWMRVFYAVSKIALSDRPQLLSSLMKNVKG